MSITDRLDQIEADIPMAERSPEMAKHFALDHGPQLLTAVRAVLDLHPEAQRHGICANSDCEDWYPCITVRAIMSALCGHHQWGVTWADPTTTTYDCATCEHEWIEEQ